VVADETEDQRRERIGRISVGLVGDPLAPRAVRKRYADAAGALAPVGCAGSGVDRKV